MPSLITLTVKPSGGDYTSLNTALASVNSNLTVSDEQVTIECSTFPSGLSEQVTVPAITQDATRYLTIKAADGHKYNHVDDSGFYLTASVAFSAVLVNSRNFTRIYDVGVKNTRTLYNGRGIDCIGSNNVLSGVYATTASSTGAIVYSLNNASGLTISNCLSYLGTTGFDFGNNFTRTASNLTAIDASSVGIDTGTANTTLKNSLSIGSPDPYLGAFNAASTNNAGDSTDTPGLSPFNNRSTADLANYALKDLRTAASSALATGGEGGTFIGYELESSGSAILVSDTISSTNSSNNNDTLSFVGAFNVSDSIANSLSQSNTDSIALAALLTVSDSLTNSDTTNNNDTVKVAGQFSITEAATNTNSANNSDAINLAASIIVSDLASNSDSTSNTDNIKLVGEFTITDTQSATTTSAHSDSVAFASIVSVADNTTNSDSASNNDLISFIGQFSVDDFVSASNSISNADTIKLIGKVNVTGNQTNTGSTNNNDTVLIGTFVFNVNQETNISALTRSTNINAATLSTNING